MDLTMTTYLLYLAITVPLTVWVASALQRHGEVFLVDVFHGDERLARAVNRLLVIGFYLLNLGYVSLFMADSDGVESGRAMMELLSTKVGGVAVVVGLVHFTNVWALSRFRRRAMLRSQALPPLEPNRRIPVAPPPPGPGPWIAPDSARPF